MGGGGGCAPRGYFGFQVAEMIKIINGSKNQNPKKSLGLPTKPPKIPGSKINPQKSHAEFRSLKNFQNALNDITRKVKD